jgi:hypothetical protein
MAAIKKPDSKTKTGAPKAEVGSKPKSGKATEKKIPVPVKKPPKEKEKVSPSSNSKEKKVKPKAAPIKQPVAKPAEKPPKKPAPAKKAALAWPGLNTKSFPNVKEIKTSNKKLTEAIKKPVIRANSKFGDAKAALSPEKEVVTTTHRSTPPLATASHRK